MSDDVNPSADGRTGGGPEQSTAPGASDPTPGRTRPMSDALLTALTTDHFVLQTAASTSVSEAVGRSTLYISALSSSLVALGFATSLPALLAPLVALIIPTIFILGIFTVARLVETGVANVSYLRQIAKLRQRYALIDEEAPAFFPTQGDYTRQAVRSLATGNTRLAPLFTAASMVATINAIVGGVGVALLVRMAAPSLAWLWIGSGVVMFFATMAVFVRYQNGRARAGES